MAIIPIRKRVVNREKLHVEMTTWWNWLVQDLQPVLAKKYWLTCFKKGFGSFLRGYVKVEMRLKIIPQWHLGKVFPKKIIDNELFAMEKWAHP